MDSLLLVNVRYGNAISMPAWAGKCLTGYICLKYVNCDNENPLYSCYSCNQKLKSLENIKWINKMSFLKFSIFHVLRNKFNFSCRSLNF